MQQDAHEFLNYLLNAISEALAEEKRKEAANGLPKANGALRKGTVTYAGDYSR